MMTRVRVSSGLCGILAVDKPAGMTSHDVVQHVRRITGERRVGHAGTLDPMATGLLLVMIGPAVRLAQFLQASEKTYEAVIAFGTETDTLDSDGQVVGTAPVPDDLRDPERAAMAIDALVGDRLQCPPAYSAIKVCGRKAYDLARKGEDTRLPPRPITVSSASLTEVVTTPDVAWKVTLTVSKGTYIRSLARDLGHDLGTVAHLASLRRTAAGPISLEQAHTLKEATDASDVSLLFVPASDALSLPMLDANADTALEVSHGCSIQAATPASGPMTRDRSLVSIVRKGRLLAVYRPEGDTLSPEVVIPGGCP